MTFNGDRIGSLIFDDGRNGLTWSPMAPWWRRTVIITLLVTFYISIVGLIKKNAASPPLISIILSVQVTRA